MFRNLDKTWRLSLSYNEIESIESMAFKSFRSLKTLDFIHNKLMVVQQKLMVSIYLLVWTVQRLYIYQAIK